MKRAGLFLTLCALLAFGPTRQIFAGGQGIFWCAQCGADRSSTHNFTHPRRGVRSSQPPQRVFVAPPREYPNVVRLANGRFRPKPGHTWVSNPPKPGDLRVRPIPLGTPWGGNPDVVHAGNGVFQPRRGYTWAGDVDAGDYRVKFIPAGTPHAYYANVEWDGSGNPRPASGFTWASNRSGEYQVVRIVRIVLTPPPNPLQGLLDRRESEQRRRRAFESGLEAYARNDFERARNAFKEASELNPENDQYRAHLRKAELGLRSLRRREMAEAYRQRFGTGVAAGTYVPTPRITELYYVQIPRATDAWFKYTDPLVDLGNAALRQVQDGARWARDVAWNQARLRAENKLKGLPGYQLYQSVKTLEERRKLLREGYHDRMVRMAERNWSAIRGAVRSAGRGADDPLAATEADRRAFLRSAGHVAEGGWVLSGQPRRPTEKSQHPTARTEVRHARGFEVNRWYER